MACEERIVSGEFFGDRSQSSHGPHLNHGIFGFHSVKLSFQNYVLCRNEDSKTLMCRPRKELQFLVVTNVNAIASRFCQPRDCSFRFWWQHDFMSNHLVFVNNTVDVSSRYVTADLKVKHTHHENHNTSSCSTQNERLTHFDIDRLKVPLDVSI